MGADESANPGPPKQEYPGPGSSASSVSDTPVVSLRPCTLYGKNTLAFLGAAAKVHAIEITASSPKAEYLGRVMSDLRSLASSQGYTSNRDSASTTRRS